MLQRLLADRVVLDQGRGELGIREARQQGVAANSQRCAFLGEGLGHIDYRGLGDRVDSLEMPRRDAIDGCHVDDAATAMLTHQFAGLHRHEEIAADVHIDGFLEGRYVGVQDMAELRVGRRVVHQDVEATELLADLCENALDLFQFADMAGDRSGLAARGVDGLGNRLAAIELATGNDHVSTLLGQQFGDGFTDAPAGAGYEGNLAV